MNIIVAVAKCMMGRILLIFTCAHRIPVMTHYGALTTGKKMSYTGNRLAVKNFK